ncbi:MAG: hypothetical protein K2Y30_15920 [Flavobacteriaceae bacterium]|nr:hypothetical protein [Flavobacteriaceae bacterium]
MINSTFKFITGKEIILYDKHRQTEPLASNQHNKEKFYFINVELIWKYIPFKTTDKRKHKAMYVVLSLLKPKYIISMNWLSQRESLYKVWTKKNPNCNFVVVQHGAYVGGIVTDEDIDHRYTKCDVFLTWGSFFVTQFNNYNSLKKVQIVNFGNSIYNELDRNSFAYNKNKGSTILLLPTALNSKNLIHLYDLVFVLKNLNFEIFVKPHSKQGVEMNADKTLKFPAMTGVNLVSDTIYNLLQQKTFSMVISDHSSSLLDAIFYKNKVLYFDPNNNINGHKTNYSYFMTNIFYLYKNLNSKDQVYELISIENQEELLKNMIHLGSNVLQ